MIIENQTAYDKIAFDKDSILNDLKVDVLPITPTQTAWNSIASIVTDQEDVRHLASINDYLSRPEAPDFAVFVTTDYMHVLSAKSSLQRFKIYAEEPIWAIDTYKTLSSGGVP
jgi:hypothetical protein